MYSPDEVIEGVYSGLIEHNPEASTYFQPQLVLSDSNRGRKILEFVLENLEECTYFRCAVAFITRSGVACIHQTLKEYVQKGGSGEILVSKYLNFSDPEAIRVLANFKNITVRFINDINFHGKTHLFEYDQYAKVLIGSSNLTQDGQEKMVVGYLLDDFKNSGLKYPSTVSQLNKPPEKVQLEIRPYQQEAIAAVVNGLKSDAIEVS